MTIKRAGQSCSEQYKLEGHDIADDMSVRILLFFEYGDHTMRTTTRYRRVAVSLRLYSIRMADA